MTKEWSGTRTPTGQMCFHGVSEKRRQDTCIKRPGLRFTFIPRETSLQ